MQFAIDAKMAMPESKEKVRSPASSERKGGGKKGWREGGECHERLLQLEREGKVGAGSEASEHDDELLVPELQDRSLSSSVRGLQMSRANPDASVPESMSTERRQVAAVSPVRQLRKWGVTRIAWLLDKTAQAMEQSPPS
ncbi:hypothetical protein AXG93_3818s1510 [Marchantia polymorpha subsp. ruderalis]|uniref:Uncharacterized protein n=1 Tax=Marchantia polymorpha subsp. ruderalis TaxID=1480154 RepID=A0A176VIG7_MARPO|nr:hypothetical protein AXG93_3818s1510 [Marchantia polymorpha subsp. ruderalis]